jgi:hypothetical protein
LGVLISDCQCCGGGAKTSVHQGFFSSQCLPPSLLKLSPFQQQPIKEEGQKQLSSNKDTLAGATPWWGPKAEDATS